MKPIITIPTVTKTYTLTVSADDAELLAMTLCGATDDAARELGQMIADAMDEADKK
jgi:hypothetical protein